MKKLILFLCLMMAVPCYAANQWQEGTGEDTVIGTENLSDLDTATFQNIVDPIDRLTSNYQRGCIISYASASSLSVAAGEIVLSNSAGTIRLFQKNSSATTVTFAGNLDTGSEAASTTYYVWAYQGTVTDSDFDIFISASSSAPTGATYYARLGSFYNDSSSDIDEYQISNDDVSINWNDVSGALKTYDSDWFAVSTSTAYTKSHSLGTTNVLILVMISDQSDGSGKIAITMGEEIFDGASYKNQTGVRELSTTQVKIRTGSNRLAAVEDIDGSQWLPTSGYCRVIMMALD